MLRLESSSGLGGRLPVLLAILGMAWAEAQQPQLQEEQTPMPGGKGLCVRQEVESMSSAEGCSGASGSQFEARALGMLVQFKEQPLDNPGAKMDGRGWAREEEG